MACIVLTHQLDTWHWVESIRTSEFVFLAGQNDGKPKCDCKRICLGPKKSETLGNLKVSIPLVANYATFIKYT